MIDLINYELLIMNYECMRFNCRLSRRDIILVENTIQLSLVP